MRLQWRWKLRTWMALIAVVAVLIPGLRLLFDYWENRHIRTIIVNDPKHIVNPTLFNHNGIITPDVICIDMRWPNAKRAIENLEAGFERRKISYRIK
jgi:hypothetical protein